MLRHNYQKLTAELKAQDLRESYMIWRRSYLLERNTRYLLAYTIIHIKNQILAKYYNVLKRRWGARKIAKQFTAQKAMKNALKCMKGWSKIAHKKKTLQKLYSEALKQKKMALKSECLNVIIFLPFRKDKNNICTLDMAAKL